MAYWAAIVTATADYALEFTKYTPGQPGGTTVTENALISTNRLDDRTFTLVLNSDSRSLEFLRSSCRDIATQYMFGIGEFEGLDPDDVVSEYVEGSKGTSPSDDTTDAPAPADAPGGDDGNPDNDGGGGCFSGETTVNVLGKGSVFMKDLQVNEQVYTGNDSRGTAVYQPVFSFGHLEHRAPMEYLRIFHNKAGSPLEISPDHLIFLAHRPAPVRADKLKKGDNLIFKCLACESTEAATITMIKTVTQNGAYLPLTPDGTIVVNNIAASSYVSIDHNTPAIVSHFGLSQHQLFHWWLSPYRMVCMGISSNLCLNDYAGNRIIHWLNIGLYFAKFGEKRHKILQALGVTIVTLLLAILNVTELALGPRLGILVLLLLLFISVSRIIGLRKKKQKCVDGVVEATEKKMI